jgi:hypothetical protein
LQEKKSSFPCSQRAGAAETLSGAACKTATAVYAYPAHNNQGDKTCVQICTITRVGTQKRKMSGASWPAILPPFILALVHSAGRTYSCETHSSPAVGGFFFIFPPLFISKFSALLTFPLINRCVRLD